MADYLDSAALVIGVAGYHHVRALPQAVLNDAQDVYQLLLDPQVCGYHPDHVRLVPDEQATAPAIRDSLAWLVQQAGKDGTAVFYFSGHGGRTANGGSYLLPIDAQLDDLPGTAVATEELTGRLRSVASPRLLVILDCCHAGGIGEVKAANAADNFKSGLDLERFYTLSGGRGRAILASSQLEEFSYTKGDLRNSLFTHYLLEALRGGATTRTHGVIRVSDVFHHVAEWVPKRDARQHPVLKFEATEDFPIARQGVALPPKRPLPKATAALLELLGKGGSLNRAQILQVRADLKALEAAAKGGTPDTVAAQRVAELIAAAGLSDADQRQARRFLRELGGPPG
jgi:hypothetical protein